jgi:hypothetical protein
MTTIARGELADSARARAHAPRDVADLVRRCSGMSGRHGFRVVARGLSGHIFFDAGRVIHAEFGEDCGLRAVVEMLRVGPVQLEATALAWPSQPSLHLSPELLLSMTERDSSRVMRKVDLPVEPPPLPDPDDALALGLVPPVHPQALRSSGVRRAAISGVMPRVEAEPGEGAVRPGVGGEAGSPSSAAPASARPASIPMSSITLRKPEEPAAARPRAARVATVPVVPAQKVRSSRAVVVSRTAKRPAVAGEPPLPALHELAAPSSEAQPTTMVRIASRGDVLAARGENAEQLAEAAAFIHGLANLIAADFGRHGRANVHLSGQGISLLVARSEVNDIAAALGPSARLTSLLHKVGLK